MVKYLYLGKFTYTLVSLGVDQGLSQRRSGQVTGPLGENDLGYKIYWKIKTQKITLLEPKFKEFGNKKVLTTIPF
jgi:hypothetical protein